MWLRCRERAIGVGVLLMVTGLVVSGCGTDREPASRPVTEEGEGAASKEVAGDDVEAVSFLGEDLVAPELDPEFRAEQEAKLDSARRALEADPGGAEELIWVGRRLAYLGRYREAIETYTRAIELHPDDPRLYRHRGHRHITTRQLDRATEDLSRAADLIEGTEDRVEPDGLPNALGIPTSTLHFNVWYHLGLAHYLAGRYEEATRAYEACLEVSDHPDSVIAATYWQYLTLKRLGRDEEAETLLSSVPDEPDVIESTAYLELLRLFRDEKGAGELLRPMGDEATLEGVTMAYGVGVRHLLEGRRDEAHSVFQVIVHSRDPWPAFGYIAAEAELARLESSWTDGPASSDRPPDRDR